MAPPRHDKIGPLRKWREYNSKYAAIAQQQISGLGIDFKTVPWEGSEQVSASQINDAYKKALTPLDAQGHPVGEGPDGDWPEGFPFITHVTTYLVWANGQTVPGFVWDAGWWGAFLSWGAYRVVFQMNLLAMVMQFEEIWQVGTGGRRGLLRR